MVTLAEDKADAFFQSVFGQPGVRSHSLQLDRLGLHDVNLEGLDHCFTEEEVWAVIRELPNEKAPGPDGFTGLFYKVVWSVIKADVMRVFNAFLSLDTRSLFLLNDAYLILLRKKPDAIELKDFRPISLIHSVSKLITKASTETQGSDQHQPKRLHQKLDAYMTTSVRFSSRVCSYTGKRCLRDLVFLLELLTFLGFSRRWCDWMAVLLASSSTKILLNGCPGRRICHSRGLRQGDPLSPMLFVVVMEALNGLIKLADQGSFLSCIRHPAVRCRALLYADDLVIFVKPCVGDLRLLMSLLDVFAGASGLHTNLSKCSATPIACSVDETAIVVNFYLGVPLHIKKLRKVDEQSIIDKVAARIPKWKGNLLNLAGRTVLVKSTLSAIPIHTAIATCLSPWAIGAIDKLRGSFLWSGSAISVAGRCKVAWPRLCRPIEYGGLGILDLRLMGLALLVRWCWLQRTDSSRVWATLPGSEEALVRDLFRASVEITLGDGATVLFWMDNWIDGLSLDVLAPNLLRAVPPRFRSRTVREALANRTWISDIRGNLDEAMIIEYVEVWEKISQVSLSPGVADCFRWRWTPDGSYSSASAYRACFLGSSFFLGAKFIWKTKVPPKVKFFAWLVAQDRCWTASRRRRHGLQDHDSCALCDQESETIDHLMLQCSFSRQVWFLALSVFSWQTLIPAASDTSMFWWSSARNRVRKEYRPGFDGLVLLIFWMIWKERNARVFNRGAVSPFLVWSKLQEDGKLWSLAGFNAFLCLASLVPNFSESLAVVLPPRSPDLVVI
ncbi:hypothetical protein U9M48_015811 [Paspalum notatum var. saurae]|uniref:Reverse transcriptase domain-containing protein n=1 Tax=Paspalum notatum var. saurae TaxID=547442 RepID=A0AAQ3T5U6_PASNO